MIAHDIIIANKKRNLRRGIAIILFMPVLDVIFSAHAIADGTQKLIAQSEPVIFFDIPAKSLADALSDFSAATNWQIDFPTELAKGLSASTISGRYTAKQALTLLLSNTGLATQVTGDKSITLVKQEQNPSLSPSGNPTKASSDKAMSSQNQPAASEKKIIHRQFSL